jgi:hypothetical protein
VRGCVGRQARAHRRQAWRATQASRRTPRTGQRRQSPPPLRRCC